VFWLADRLHKTPKEIREGFTLADFDHWLAYLEMKAELERRRT
jgi:hypothetical protein